MSFSFKPPVSVFPHQNQDPIRFSSFAFLFSSIFDFIPLASIFDFIAPASNFIIYFIDLASINASICVNLICLELPTRYPP